MSKNLCRLLLCLLLPASALGELQSLSACPDSAGELAVGASLPRAQETAGGCQTGGAGICVAFARQAVFRENIQTIPEFGRFYQHNTFPAVPGGYEGRVETYPFFGMKIEKGSGLTAEIAQVMDYAATGRGNSINFDIGGVDLAVALRIKQLTAALISEPGNRVLRRQLLDIQSDRYNRREGLWTEWELSRMAYFGYLAQPNVRIYRYGVLLTGAERQAVVDAMGK